MSLSLASVMAFTENQAREYLEAIRWPGGPTCVHCGGVKVYRLQGKSTRPGLLKCRDCKGQQTVTTGTVMHGSHITLRQWAGAFHMLCSAKKGVSALQLQRNLGLGSYRTAWHLAHRIRFAMQEKPLSDLLKGTVEVDETYIGGKPRRGAHARLRRGRGTRKTPVLALVERSGRVRSHRIESVSGKTLKAAIRDNVDRDAAIMTDEWAAYVGIGGEFKGGHHVVRHTAGEYSRHGVNVNTAESYFALMKRGIMGAFHHVSKQHLDRYCDEFTFRWDRRKWTDGRRLADGRRQAADLPGATKALNFVL